MSPQTISDFARLRCFFRHDSAWPLYDACAPAPLYLLWRRRRAKRGPFPAFLRKTIRAHHVLLDAGRSHALGNLLATSPTRSPNLTRRGRITHSARPRAAKRLGGQTAALPQDTERVIGVESDTEMPLDELGHALAGPEVAGPAMKPRALKKQGLQLRQLPIRQPRRRPRTRLSRQPNRAVRQPAPAVQRRPGHAEPAAECQGRYALR